MGLRPSRSLPRICMDTWIKEFEERLRRCGMEERLIKIAIHEGRNRQVRRMCESIGHPVIRLVRSRIGPIVDRSLHPGSFRELTNHELGSIRKILLKDFSD